VNFKTHVLESTGFKIHALESYLGYVLQMKRNVINGKENQLFDFMASYLN